jgi:hypothetical protein
MNRAPVFAAAALVLLSGAASACEGQPGKTVFEDNFSDDSGGWPLIKDYADLKNNMLVVRPNLGAKDATLVRTLAINTFSQIDGDYCEDFVMPKSPDADVSVSVGLEFWQKDTATLYNFTIFSNKTAGLYRLSNSNWTTIYQEVNNASIKTEDNAVNTLRVIAKAGKLTMSINGVPFKAIRAQSPDGEAHFGVYTGVTKPTDADTTVVFKDFKVTTGQ